MPGKMSPKPFCLWITGGIFLAVASMGIRPNPVSANEFERGPGGLKEIALTFDAGGEAESFAQLLQAVSAAGVQCTFFVTGQWATDHPEFVRRLAQNGQEIGNHSWSHLDMIHLADSTIVREIGRTDELLTNLLGRKPARLFRAPFGSSNARVRAAAASLGFQPVSWSLDSLDSVGEKKSPYFLFERIVMRRDEDLDGAVVLMHVGEPATAAVVPYLIRTLHARGFRCVPISQMIRQSK